MKKTHGLARSVLPLTAQELQAMPTRQLLARLERLRRCEESLAHSDLTAQEVDGHIGILFKESRAWQQAYGDVKQVLATREHVGATRPKNG